MPYGQDGKLALNFRIILRKHKTHILNKITEIDLFVEISKIMLKMENIWPRN